MPQRNAVVQVTGNIVKWVRKAGSMPDRENPQGPAIVWDYIEAKMLTPEFDTLDVRFPVDGSIPVPLRDELVTLTCEVSSFGGNLKFVCQSVAPASEPLHAVKAS